MLDIIFRWAPNLLFIGHELPLEMHGSKTVSVVLPAYNEAGYIRPAVDDFFVPDIVDEVIVVDNNSRDATAAEARQTRARVVQESRQGYGYALQRGIHEAIPKTSSRCGHARLITLKTRR